ncbi:hypothetical protein J7K41_00845 [Candidatus Micrarchaeota archaeon]|nr:hypothetical protein [Candidatus Micrarchaeota archaeon]
MPEIKTKKVDKTHVGEIKFSKNVKDTDIKLTLQRVELARKNNEWNTLTQEDVRNINYILKTEKDQYKINKALEYLILIAKHEPGLINEDTISTVIDVIENCNHETFWRGVSVLISTVEKGKGKLLVPYLDDLLHVRNSKTDKKERSMINRIFDAMVTLNNQDVRKEVIKKMFENFDEFYEVLKGIDHRLYPELVSLGLIHLALENENASKLLGKILKIDIDVPKIEESIRDEQMKDLIDLIKRNNEILQDEKVSNNVAQIVYEKLNKMEMSGKNIDLLIDTISEINNLTSLTIMEQIAIYHPEKIKKEHVKRLLDNYGNDTLWKRSKDVLRIIGNQQGGKYREFRKMILQRLLNCRDCEGLINDIARGMGERLDRYVYNHKMYNARMYVNQLSEEEVIALAVSDPELMLTTSNKMVLNRLKTLCGEKKVTEYLSENIPDKELFKNLSYNFYQRILLYNELALFSDDPDLINKMNSMFAMVIKEDYNPKKYYLLSKFIEQSKHFDEGEYKNLVQNLRTEIENKISLTSGRHRYALEYLLFQISDHDYNTLKNIDPEGVRVAKMIRTQNMLDPLSVKKDGIIKVVQIFDYENAVESDWKTLSIEETENWLKLKGITYSTEDFEKYGFEGTRITANVKGIKLIYEFVSPKRKEIGDKAEYAKNALKDSDIIAFRGHSYNLLNYLKVDDFEERNLDRRIIVWLGSCTSAYAIPLYQSHSKLKAQYIGVSGVGLGDVNIHGINYLVENIIERNMPVKYSQLGLVEYLSRYHNEVTEQYFSYPGIGNEVDQYVRMMFEYVAER